MMNDIERPFRLNGKNVEPFYSYLCRNMADNIVTIESLIAMTDGTIYNNTLRSLVCKSLWWETTQAAMNMQEGVLVYGLDTARRKSADNKYQKVHLFRNAIAHFNEMNYNSNHEAIRWYAANIIDWDGCMKFIIEFRSILIADLEAKVENLRLLGITYGLQKQLTGRRGIALRLIRDLDDDPTLTV